MPGLSLDFGVVVVMLLVGDILDRAPATATPEMFPGQGRVALGAYKEEESMEAERESWDGRRSTTATSTTAGITASLDRP
jgi:hypothetical protein